MENGENEDAATPSRAVTGWTVGLICVAIVAAGVMVGGLLHKPEPELTTKPVTPTTVESSEPPEISYVKPPVQFPVQLPGCDVVEPPVEDELTGMAFSGDTSYDNPAYPWFSAPKAGAMTQALHAALPDDAEIAFAAVDSSLVFQPILGDPGESAEYGGWTMAWTRLRRGDRAGELQVTVQQSAKPIPPCIAGRLDERRRLPDGTVVDTQDTWYETNGVRTLTRDALAHLPDGSRVYAYASDTTDDTNTGAIPLTIDELVTLVTVPELRVTAPVPPGTPNPPESCRLGVGDSGVIDEAQARRLDAVLARIPLDGLTLDRPLGTLRPADWHDGVCQVVRVTTPGQQSRLSITITIGQSLPSESSARRLPDGSVVENEEEGWGTTRSVTVTYPSGTRVEIYSEADTSAEPLSFERLEAIALAPGLEVR